MRRQPDEPDLAFLFDEHVNARALEELRARGVDVVHVTEVGLAGADDAALFEWARAQSRLIVTRNYQDFAPIVEHANRGGVSFPAVLFYAASIPQADAGAHIRGLERWLARARGEGRNTAENTIDWIVSGD